MKLASTLHQKLSAIYEVSEIKSLLLTFHNNRFHFFQVSFDSFYFVELQQLAIKCDRANLIGSCLKTVCSSTECLGIHVNQCLWCPGRTYPHISDPPASLNLEKVLFLFLWLTSRTSLPSDGFVFKVLCWKAEGC